MYTAWYELECWAELVFPFCRQLQINFALSTGGRLHVTWPNFSVRKTKQARPLNSDKSKETFGYVVLFFFVKSTIGLIPIFLRRWFHFCVEFSIRLDNFSTCVLLLLLLLFLNLLEGFSRFDRRIISGLSSTFPVQLKYLIGRKLRETSKPLTFN